MTRRHHFPGAPAAALTRGEADAAYASLLHRMVWLYVILFALGTVAVGYLQYQTVAVDRDSWQRCADRNVNIVSSNLFNQKMADLEATNQFIDQTLRDKRVALYRNRVLSAADCGPRP